MVFSFLIEALLISFVGGALGCVAVLPLNGFTTGAMNWQTFSHMAFAFQDYALPALGWNHLRSGHGSGGRPVPGDPRGTSTHLRRPALVVSVFL